MSKKMSSSTLENCIQEGYQFCLRCFILLSVFVACELDCLVCSAGVIKPFYSGTPDAMPDFPNLFSKIGIILQFHLPENELIRRRGFNFPSEQFNVTTEPLSLHQSIIADAQSKTNPKADKATEKWYEKLLHHWRFYSVMLLAGYVTGFCRNQIKRQAWRLVDILSSLELPPEKGCVWKRQTNQTTESGWLKTAIRLTAEAARHFRESFAFLRAGLRCFGRFLKNLATSSWIRFRCLLCIPFSRQRQKQISHPSQDSYSCPKSDAK
jgi:hypothetical protein